MFKYLSLQGDTVKDIQDALRSVMNPVGTLLPG